MADTNKKGEVELDALTQEQLERDMETVMKKIVPDEVSEEELKKASE